jgi:hypothetical protein
MPPKEPTILFEDCRIMFRNFEGRATQYNRDGDRNFCVLLDPEMADQLSEDGWNVKSLKPRDPDSDPQPYLQVSVGYKYRPPKIVLITHRGRNDLPEEMIGMIDWIDIAKVDLIVRPFDWEVNGKTGKKAYVKTLFITVAEDALELKYADIREIGAEAEFVEGEVLGEVVHNQRAIGS